MHRVLLLPPLLNCLHMAQYNPFFSPEVCKMFIVIAHNGRHDISTHKNDARLDCCKLTSTPGRCNYISLELYYTVVGGNIL